MLVLSRKADEKIQIGPNITITILQVKGMAVRIGIEAPNDVRVLRGELLPAPANEEKSSAPPAPAAEASKHVRRGSVDRLVDHRGASYLAISTQPSAESPRCRVPRVGTTPPVQHPLRTGPASAADGLARGFRLES